MGRLPVYITERPPKNLLSDRYMNDLHIPSLLFQHIIFSLYIQVFSDDSQLIFVKNVKFFLTIFRNCAHLDVIFKIVYDEFKTYATNAETDTRRTRI